MNDTTAKLIRDASCGPGDDVKRFCAAAPAKRGKLTPAQRDALAAYAGVAFGFVSKTLIYDTPVRYATIAEKRALASLLKAGILQAEEVSGSIPFASEFRVGAQGPYHYVLRVVL